VLSQASDLVLVEAASCICGPIKQPSERWGRLSQAFRLSSQDAESIG
jgi:hypothetical protein